MALRVLAARAAPVWRAAPRTLPAARAAPHRLSTTAAAATAGGEGGLGTYTVGMSWLHWAAGGGLIANIGLVKAAQWTKDKKAKGYYMWCHKSIGVALLAVIVPRVGLRLASRLPPSVPGHALEQLAARVSHFALHGLALGLPVSGVVMGYFGGKGLPFFTTLIPGLAEPQPSDKQLAGKAYKAHKLMGQAITYLVPIHTGAALFHFARGQNLFSRFAFK